MRLSEVHAAESVAYLNKALVKLQDIWDEIGIPEEQRVKRTGEVHKHVKSLLDLMIEEEKALKRQLLNNIEKCRKELAILCKELHRPPFKEEEGISILQLEKDSRICLETLEKQKQQRLEALKDLIDKDHDLCDIMCTTPFSIDKSVVPSAEQLESFHSYINNLTKEKERRHGEFMSIRKEILACMSDLEQQPETSFEMDVACEDDEDFCLSDDNISNLKLLLSRLQERKAENEQLCSGFRTKIQELWERLQIPQEEQAAFSEHMVNSKKKNLEALQTELQRLEVLKRQSMRTFTEAIRAEITLLWNKCFYSSEQREAFVSFHDDDFTEELLNLHESEAKSLKKYYEDHKELFEGVTKWQETWSLYLELEKKANDPSRFNNRGGNLLKEEKQRADLHKSLPKLEKSLKSQVEAWEQEHNREFLVNGQKFLEYVKQQWETHHEEKEREKLERQLKKTRQTQEEMFYGTTKTPSKRRMPGTPSSSKLRKLNGTSTVTTPNSFLGSGLGGTMCHSYLQKPPLSANKKELTKASKSNATPGLLNSTVSHH
ncbi:protein regulator of cytokinesis 1 isoform X2 [Austrofundulus limnaeus]|uniref:Protein regulator of cytokinesis 1 isoform X2 n=1 Tax=Austrofundulus limnaeus TaxID=52670 RepID=A0A2I4BMS0_AUSLI|nr:PREDICTED: protein regulator of cytokinesis 1-like isoform X2 [Austrofundulus limnaeus]